MLVTAINILARILDIAAKLASLVRTHPASVCVSGAAVLSLRLRPHRIALRLRSPTLRLNGWLEAKFLSERPGCRGVRNDQCNQPAKCSKNGVHAQPLERILAAHHDAVRSAAAPLDGASAPVKHIITPRRFAGEGVQESFVDIRISESGQVRMDAY